MGLTISNLFQRFFGKKNMRILMGKRSYFKVCMLGIMILSRLGVCKILSGVSN